MRYTGKNGEGYARDIAILAEAYVLDDDMSYSVLCDGGRRIADDYDIPNERDVFADVEDEIAAIRAILAILGVR